MALHTIFDTLTRYDSPPPPLSTTAIVQNYGAGMIIPFLEISIVEPRSFSGFSIDLFNYPAGSMER